MNNDDLKKRKILMLGFAVPLLGFLLWRLAILAPQLFGIAVKVLLITIVIAAAYTIVRRKAAMKCAKCGGAMVNEGTEKISKGALAEEDDAKLDSLGKVILRCEDCGNEYHELIYYKSSSGDAADYQKDMEASEVLLGVMNSEIPGRQQKLKVNKMTKEEYRRMKRKFADEVIQHNTRNGFAKDPIKIDLEE